MALTYTKIHSSRPVNFVAGSGSGDFTSASFTTQAGTLLLAIVSLDSQGSIQMAASDIPLPTTGGLTWAKISGASTDDPDGASPFTNRTHMYWADNASGGSKTFAMSGASTRWDNDVGCIDLVILEFTGALAVASQAGGVAATRTVQGAGNDPGAVSVTLSAAPASTSITVAAFGCDGDGVSSVTPGTGWVEEYDATSGGAGGPYLSCQVQTRATGSTSATVNWNDVDASNTGRIFDYSRVALEVQDAGGAGTPDATPGGKRRRVHPARDRRTGVRGRRGPLRSFYRHRQAGVTSTALTRRTASFPVPTSISGRKVLDQNSNVYLAYVMSSWTLHDLSNANITIALEGADANGFNGVVVWGGAGMSLNATWDPRYQRKADSSEWWTGTAWQSSLGPAWAAMDWIATECERLGMTLHFSFCGGNGASGARPDWEAASNAQMYDVGVAVATRYYAYPNIVWHMMLDDTQTPGSTTGQRVNALFDGINDTEGPTSRPVRWMEVANGVTTNGQSWYDPTGATTDLRCSINCIYSYDFDSVVEFETGWADTSGPTGDCEPRYIGNPYTVGNAGQQYRERGYTVFLEGGCIINFGHEDWWPFGKTGLFTDGETWDTVQADDEVVDAGHAWSLFETYLKDTTYAPVTTFVTTGEGTTDTKAAQGASNTAALAYFPDNRTVQVDTTIIAGTGLVRLRWYDPTAGTYSTIAASEAQQTGRAVTLPAARGDSTRDFVLVVDLATDVTAQVATITLTAVAGTPSAGAVTITAQVATLTLTPLAGTITAGARTITAQTATLTLTPIPGVTSATVTVQAQVATLTLTPLAGTVTGGAVSKAAQVAVLTLTPVVGAVSVGGVTVTAQVATVTLTPLAGTVTGGAVSKSAQVAALTLTPVAGTVSATVTVPAQVAALTLTSIAGTVTGAAVTVTAQVATLTLTAIPGATAGQQTIEAQVATITLTTVAGTITGGATTTTAQVGTLALTANPGVTTSSQSVTAQVATVTLTAIAGTATGGAATVTAQVATLTLTAIPGAASTSGGPQNVTAQVATITLTPRAGTVTGGTTTTSAQVATLTLTAVPGIVGSGIVVTAQTATITLTAVAGTISGGTVTVAAQPATLALTAVTGTVSGGAATFLAQVAVLTLLARAGVITSFLPGPPSLLRVWHVLAEDRTLAPIHDRIVKLPPDARYTGG